MARWGVCWRGVLLGSLAWLATHCCISATPSLDLAFDPGKGPNGPVHTLIPSPDGKVVLAGSFTKFDDQSRSNIVRLLTDGHVDPQFDPGKGIGGYTSWRTPVPQIHSLTVYPDGRVLCGGDFSEVQGVPRLRLSRFLPDGSLDPSFSPAIENAPGETVVKSDYPGSVVYTVHLRSDGRILVGGEFQYANGVARRNIAQFREDGTLDNTFDPTGSLEWIDSVRLINAWSDGSIAIAGTRLYWDYDYMCRLFPDGRRDVAFDAALDPTLSVKDIEVGPEGELIVAGRRDLRRFSNETPGSAFASRLLTDGRLVATNGLAYGTTVKSISVDTDGGFFLAGDFPSLLGRHREFLGRIGPTGSLDHCFGHELRIDGPLRTGMTEVSVVRWIPERRQLYLAGNFSEVDGVRRFGIARLRHDPLCATGEFRFASSEFFSRRDHGPAQITIERSNAINEPSSVHFETQNVTALSGVDDLNTSQTLHFAAGEWSKTVLIPLKFQSGQTGDQTVRLTLSNATGLSSLGEPHQANLHIRSVSGLETVLVESNGEGFTGFTHSTGNFVAPVQGGRMLTPRWLLDATAPFEGTLVGLHPDGSPDVDFKPRYVAPEGIYRLVEQDDGKVLLLAGWYSSDGTYAAHLVRLNSDTTEDRSFHPPRFDPQATPGGPAVVYLAQVTVLPQERLLVVGRFRVVQDGVEYIGAVRLLPDGRLDPSFRIDARKVIAGSDGFPLADGGIVMLATLNNGLTSRREYTRWSQQGLQSLEFQSSDEHNGVDLWLMQQDGRALLSPSPAFPVPASELFAFRWTAHGERDVSFRPLLLATRRATNSPPREVRVSDGFELADGSILAAGQFDFAGGLPRPIIARLRSDGEVDPGFRMVLSDVVRDGTLYQPSAARLGAVEADWVLALVTFTAMNVSNTPSFRAIRLLKMEERTTPSAFELPTGTIHSVMEAQGEILLPVYRGGSAQFGASVRVRTEAETARAGSDFDPIDEVLQFEPGERQKWVRLSIRDDPFAEDDEFLTLRLLDPTGGGSILGADSVSITIGNDDHGFEFEQLEHTVGELDRLVDLKVVRTGVPTSGVSVDYSVRPVTANPDQDFVPHTGTLYFDTAQAREAHIVLEITDDAVAEGDETFEVLLSQPTGGATLREHAVSVVRITDNDIVGRPGRGVDKSIRALAVTHEGAVLVGGDFTRVNGIQRQGLARLRSDLILDERFDAHLESGTRIDQIALQPDAGILIQGSFDCVQGQQRHGMARIHDDGILDSEFHPTFGLTPDCEANSDPETTLIQSMAVLPDARLLLAGTFTEVNGVPRPGLARLLRDGTLDESFDPHRDGGGPPGWSPGIPASLGALPGGEVLIGLRIPRFYGFDGSSVLRLSPSGRIDPNFAPALTSRCISMGGAGPFSVQGLVVLRNGKTLVMRVFDYSSCDIWESPLVSLNPDGTEDTAFGYNLPWPRYLAIGGDWSSITQVAEAPDGALWAGGLRELVRLGPDGSIDFDHWSRSRLNLVPRLRLGGYRSSEHGLVRTAVDDPPEVSAIAVKPDGRLLVAGNFLACAGTPSFGLIEFYPDGTPRESVRVARSRRAGTVQFTLEVTAPEGESFDLERSTDLTTWDTVLTSKVLSSPMTLPDPQPPIGSYLFYRIRMHRP